MQRIIDVIKSPVVSEKSTALAEVANRYVFKVDRQATKLEIKQAIEELFHVKVRQVRTMITHGKFKRMRNAVVKKPNEKKAIITLAEGQKIDLFQTQPVAKG